MPGFEIINNSSEIKLNNEWIDSLSFKNKGSIVNDQGKPVSLDYAGRQYQLIIKKERIFSFWERVNRAFLDILATVRSLDFTLSNKVVKKLFTKNHESIRFGIPFTKINEIKNISLLLELVRFAQQQKIQPHNFIMENGITNQQALIAIAKLAAQQDESGASEYIQNYGIKDEQALVDIAKLAAQQDGWGASKFIQRYGIQDKQALIEIAKLATQQCGYRTSECIKNYGIQDKQALIEIAKLAAQQDGCGTSAYIQNYDIQDGQALIGIAKLAAQQDGWGTSECIKNYGIQDKQALIEIAKLATQQCGYRTSECIKNYGIQDKQALIEIAKLAAQQDGWGISEFIQNYGIQDEQTLIEIAKLAAQQNGRGASKFIQNYGIQDEQALVDIAKLAAQQDGWGTSEFIQNYGIQDEQDLVDIAKLAAQQNGRGASKYIQNYGIQNETVVKEIFLECMRYHPACSRRILTTHFTEEKKGLPAIFLPIEEDIAKMQDSLKANNTRNWMTYTLLLIEQKQVTLTGSLEEQKIFQKIATYPDPRMRNELSYIVCEVLQNYRQQYINLSTVGVCRFIRRDEERWLLHNPASKTYLYTSQLKN